MFTTGTTLSSQHRLVLEQNPKKQQKKIHMACSAHFHTLPF